jgi:hypothetical protein
MGGVTARDEDARGRQSGGGLFVKVTAGGFLQNVHKIRISSSW